MADLGAVLVKPVSAETVAAFETHLPDVPLAELCRTAELYQVIADGAPTSPARIVLELARVDRIVETLLSELQKLSTGSGDALAIVRARHGGPSEPEMMNSLRAFRATLWTAERDIPARERKRPPSPRGWLVRTLAAILIDAGVAADARPSGQLAKAVTIVLDHADEKKVSRVPVVIRNALATVAN